ncbi:MAG: hypothetical protein ABI280_11220, partial [Ginsengibacter sp.]
VKINATTFFIVETKGREDLDDVRKIKRLATWCQDINKVQSQYSYTPVYIKQEDWEKMEKDLKTFKEVVKIFKVG